MKSDPLPPLPSAFNSHFAKQPTCVGRFIMRRSQQGREEQGSADEDEDSDLSGGPSDVESLR